MALQAGATDTVNCGLLLWIEACPFVPTLDATRSGMGPAKPAADENRLRGVPSSRRPDEGRHLLFHGRLPCFACGPTQSFCCFFVAWELMETLCGDFSPSGGRRYCSKFMADPLKRNGSMPCFGNWTRPAGWRDFLENGTGPWMRGGMADPVLLRKIPHSRHFVPGRASRRGSYSDIRAE